MSATAQSLEELIENPAKFGIPTFDEYRRNKERYRGRYDDEVASIDAGDKILGVVQRYVVWDGGCEYRVESLEQAERIAGDMGLNLHQDFIVDPQIRDDGPGRFHNRVTFRSKRAVNRRSEW
jgi:hypothetical protein